MKFQQGSRSFEDSGRCLTFSGHLYKKVMVSSAEFEMFFVHLSRVQSNDQKLKFQCIYVHASIICTIWPADLLAGLSAGL
jgi:hypothetical protein